MAAEAVKDRPDLLEPKVQAGIPATIEPSTSPGTAENIPPAPADPSIYDAEESDEPEGEGIESPGDPSGEPVTAPPAPDPLQVARSIVSTRLDLIIQAVGPTAISFLVPWIMAKRGKILTDEQKKRLEKIVQDRLAAPDWPAALESLVLYLERHQPEVYKWFLSNDTELAPLAFWGLQTANEIRKEVMA